MTIHYTEEDLNGKLLSWGAAYHVCKNQQRRWNPAMGKFVNYAHIITALGGQEVYIEQVDGKVYRWSFDKNLRKTREFFTN